LGALSFVFAVGGCASTAPRENADQIATNTAEGDSPLAKARQDYEKRDGFGLDKQNMDTEGLPVSDADIAKVLDWHALLPDRARVALLEARAVREWCTCGSWGSPDVRVEGTQWAVRPTPSEEVEAMRAELARSSRVSNASTVPAMLLPLHADLGRCRYTAARANSDLILLYAKATRVLRFRNNLANLYPTILGLLLPGEETQIVSRVEGALVDVRTGRVFAVSQATAKRSDASSPFTSSQEKRDELLEGAERDAVVSLAKGIREELESTPACAPLMIVPAPGKAAHE
jgi:hypothetical protein